VGLDLHPQHGGLTLLAFLFGLTIGRKDDITHEAIPAEGPKSPTA
jgi:hypothetical protein